LDALQSAYDRNAECIQYPDKQGNTPLHWAAEHGRVEACGLLISLGASCAAINLNGDTPLHRAAAKNHPNVCELLMHQGNEATRDKKNKENKTPLDILKCDSIVRDRNVSQRAKETFGGGTSKGFFGSL
jgi:ankyrin repeat protein